MKLSRIIRRRKYKASKQKIDLFYGTSQLNVEGGLPPKLEKPLGRTQDKSVQDIFESIRRLEQSGKA